MTQSPEGKEFRAAREAMPVFHSDNPVLDDEDALAQTNFDVEELIRSMREERDKQLFDVIWGQRDTHC